MIKKWQIGDKHPHYGRVAAMGIREGEPYRIFIDKHGVVSLIPLPCLMEADDDKVSM
jgi:putative component of toxin-antitoxin plasmid stabilization module